MTEKEITELCHNVFNPLAIINGEVHALKNKGSITEEEAKILADQVARIEKYIRSLSNFRKDSNDVQQIENQKN